MTPSARFPSSSWRDAERHAELLLQRRGWITLASNWSCRWGEIDLLCGKAGRLLLVEVKARHRSGADGWGIAALGAAKRRRLSSSFICWLVDQPLWHGASVEMVLALVPLPVGSRPVRWLRIDG
jgi:putative endonuclease